MIYKELKKNDLYKVTKIRNYTINGDSKPQYLVESIMKGVFDNYIVIGTGHRLLEMDIDLVSPER